MTPLRPRVEGDREEEILEAAVHLLLETGYDRLTMDAVAREARASKATLYRRWESKPELVIDALMRAKNMPEIRPTDTGSLRGDLVAAFCGQHGIANQRGSAVMGAVITAVSTDEEFARQFREQFIAPKLAASAEIYRRAIERGEISPDVDLEIIGPALAGVCLHRMYVLGAEPDDATIERVVDHLILPALRHPPEAAERTGTTATGPSSKPTSNHPSNHPSKQTSKQTRKQTR